MQPPDFLAGKTPAEALSFPTWKHGHPTQAVITVMTDQERELEVVWALRTLCAQNARLLAAQACPDEAQQTERNSQQSIFLCQQELAVLRNSLSWRITAPLRWFARPLMSPAAAVDAALQAGWVGVLKRWVVSKPRLAALALQILKKIPALHGRMTQLPGQRAEASAVSLCSGAGAMTADARRIQARLMAALSQGGLQSSERPARHC